MHLIQPKLSNADQALCTGMPAFGTHSIETSYLIHSDGIAAGRLPATQHAGQANLHRDVRVATATEPYVQGSAALPPGMPCFHTGSTAGWQSTSNPTCRPSQVPAVGAGLSGPFPTEATMSQAGCMPVSAQSGVLVPPFNPHAAGSRPRAAPLAGHQAVSNTVTNSITAAAPSATQGLQYPQTPLLLASHPPSQPHDDAAAAVAITQPMPAAACLTIWNVASRADDDFGAARARSLAAQHAAAHTQGVPDHGVPSMACSKRPAIPPPAAKSREETTAQPPDQLQAAPLTQQVRLMAPASLLWAWRMCASLVGNT